jgi:hypothetical protein
MTTLFVNSRFSKKRRGQRVLLDNIRTAAFLQALGELLHYLFLCSIIEQLQAAK